MQLKELDIDELRQLVSFLYEELANGGIVEFKSTSQESTYKDALYSGYVDQDMEFESVVPGLSNVTIEGTDIKLNGDLVELVPEYKSINLYCKKFKVTGLTKAEIISTMILKMESMKIGEYMEWDKYLIQYKGHTLVANTKGAIAGLKLLKNDRMARKIYTKQYPKVSIHDWTGLKDSEKIFGNSEISMPGIVDQRLEECSVAMELLDDSMRYDACKQLIEEYGFNKYLETDEYELYDAV